LRNFAPVLRGVFVDFGFQAPRLTICRAFKSVENSNNQSQSHRLSSNNGLPFPKTNALFRQTGCTIWQKGLPLRKEVCDLVTLSNLQVKPFTSYKCLFPWGYRLHKWGYNLLIEGSLEVKLPTIWIDERWEESEKRREEERRSKKRKSQKIEDPGARKGREVAKHCVVPMICGPGGWKSRLAKAAGAELCGQMRDAKLWREARFQVKMYKTHQGRTTFGS